MSETTEYQLPGLNCGLCGYRTCDEFQERLASAPEMLRRCIHLSKNRVRSESSATAAAEPKDGPVADTTAATRRVDGIEDGAGRLPVYAVGGNPGASCGACAGEEGFSTCAVRTCAPGVGRIESQQTDWLDHLGREFDFYLEHFPEEPGPREIILPHNPLLTREMNIQVGDILIGRPLGMSCGCPITHCGVVMEVDHRTGVIVWCVTGPLGPRQKGYKDLGYYIAEGYEGLVKETRCELRIGMRYFFQPRMCMLQWRHSGLINYLSRNGGQYQVRVEGLWIG
ncbi:MAG: (Fe-S)-binding protein [Thermoguttaceae bacterium]